MNLSNSDRYRIGHSPRPAQESCAPLDAFIADMRAEAPYIVGFPANLDFGFSRFAGLLDIFATNVGDPDSEDKARVGVKDMELAVVDFVARLANGDPSRTYGYVTGGGTEANQFGLDRGCDLLPQARIYCSRATHYSVRKSAKLMRKELVVVDCDEQGRIDIDALARACDADTGRGAVVVANIGTTMTGAIDDVDAIITAASAAGRVYVHLDAALSGLILPFTPERAAWGFVRKEVGSVTVCMHKALGMPMPSALALCRSELVSSEVAGEYIGATDATLAGCRSGLAVALIWQSLAAQGMAGLELTAQTSLEMAERAVEKLADAGLRPSRNPLSIMVTFDRPAEWICRKYHLATVGDRARIVTVSHVRKQVIDELCHDVATDGR
ncbi:aminotransferase class I/II-fold pyridoxal phosphate-dependent enzyme [Nocardia sp. NBC_01009]|uniref:aminotransferase class I/II-fold pyridoxal phosphate-dependent enzyme n=1 Tax=Nocardia sp. NBC_01009 TaxID=2975996 RepID=UPI00386B11AF|nr:aminotransferase class I/II-fold pyridoxal phosphate-dependent enzyme [Nocardia sp. NBC_01009]